MNLRRKFKPALMIVLAIGLAQSQAWGADDFKHALTCPGVYTFSCPHNGGEFLAVGIVYGGQCPDAISEAHCHARCQAIAAYTKDNISCPAKPIDNPDDDYSSRAKCFPEMGEMQHTDQCNESVSWENGVKYEIAIVSCECKRTALCVVEDPKRKTATLN